MHVFAFVFCANVYLYNVHFVSYAQLSLKIWLPIAHSRRHSQIENLNPHVSFCSDSFNIYIFGNWLCVLCCAALYMRVSSVYINLKWCMFMLSRLQFHFYHPSTIIILCRCRCRCAHFIFIIDFLRTKKESTSKIKLFTDTHTSQVMSPKSLYISISLFVFCFFEERNIYIHKCWVVYFLHPVHSFRSTAVVWRVKLLWKCAPVKKH